MSVETKLKDHSPLIKQKLTKIWSVKNCHLGDTELPFHLKFTKKGHLETKCFIFVFLGDFKYGIRF